MWTYQQANGKMFDALDKLLAIGYSGAGAGKNDPAMQNVAFVGPLPSGLYTIERPADSPIHGPFAMPLAPDAANRMFGRGGFMIHGDSIEHPGAASEGCIILPRFARDRIWESGDRRLCVISGGG